MGRRMVDLINMDIDNFFKAESMMTKSDDIHFFNNDSSIEEIRHHLEINNFDIALIRNNYAFQSYIYKKDLQSCDNIDEIIHRINDEEIIAPNASISEIINAFQNRKFLFVMSDGDFLGLITYADLNKYPLQVFCYMAIIEFEKRLKNIVSERFPNEEWLKKLSPSEKNYIGGIYISEKSDGVERSLVDCTNLIHLTEILNIDDFRRIIGIEVRKNYESEMKKINDWRNAIMHNRALVSNEDGGKELYDFIDKLGQYITNIQ